MRRHNTTTIIMTLVLCIISFAFAGCSHEFSDVEAVGILNSKLDVNIPIDSVHLISSEYETNFREYGFLIVVDIDCPNTREIVSTLRLIPTDLSEEANDGMPNELLSILNRYFDDNQLIYCRYEYDHLLNGEEHTASVYLIALSAKGRLLLYEDI